MIPLSIKTNREWKDPEGYRWLAPWTNLMLLRFFVRLYTPSLPKGEWRRKNQMDDAGRSMVSTLEEGWKRPSTKEYLDFLGFTQASLEEVRGDNYRNLNDGYIRSRPGSSLKDLGVDLKEFKEFLGRRNLKEIRGRNIEEIRRIEEKHSFKPLKEPLEENLKDPLRDPVVGDYLPLKGLKAEDLTYEIMMELINKTDYLLRNLVKSLQESGEKKMEVKKDPREWEAQQGDGWLEETMKKLGHHKLENGQWVKD